MLTLLGQGRWMGCRLCKDRARCQCLCEQPAHLGHQPSPDGGHPRSAALPRLPGSHPLSGLRRARTRSRACGGGHRGRRCWALECLAAALLERVTPATRHHGALSHAEHHSAKPSSLSTQCLACMSGTACCAGMPHMCGTACCAGSAAPASCARPKKRELELCCTRNHPQSTQPRPTVEHSKTL